MPSSRRDSQVMSLVSLTHASDNMMVTYLNRIECDKTRGPRRRQTGWPPRKSGR